MLALVCLIQASSFQRNIYYKTRECINAIVKFMYSEVNIVRLVAHNKQK